jgi:hypothetical protein
MRIVVQKLLPILICAILVGIRHETNIDRGTLQPKSRSIVTKRFLICISSAIVALSRIANDLGDGRKRNEEVDILWQVLMQVPGSLDLGSNASLPLLECHCLKWCVLMQLARVSPVCNGQWTHFQNHGKLYNTPDIPLVLLSVAHEFTQLLCIGTIAA